MLQDKAKVTIELDVDLAEKQLDDTKKSLDDNTKLTFKKVDKAKEDTKKEGEKEVERQKVGLSEKLRRIAQMPSRLLAADLPEQLISGGAFALGALTGVPGAGAAAGRGSAFYWKNADNLQIAAAFGEAMAKDIPGLGSVAKALKKAATLAPDVNTIREIKSKWEAVGKTVEDVTSAFTGAVTAGQIPSPAGSKTFISNLYEYNAAVGGLNKNRRYLQKKIFAEHGADVLIDLMKTKTGGNW